MALAKMCDICEHVEKVSSHTVKVKGWARLVLDVDDQDDASKGQGVQVMQMEVCGDCAVILRGHMKDIVERVMTIRTDPRRSH